MKNYCTKEKFIYTIYIQIHLAFIQHIIYINTIWPILKSNKSPDSCYSKTF